MRKRPATPGAPRSLRARPVVVTIDGPGGVGKSTVAQLLARRLGLVYLDTGATYRALAYAARAQGLNPVTDVDALTRLAAKMPLHLEPDPTDGLRVLLNGRDISDEIRTEGISEAAAQVSQHTAVRRAMVQLQRRLAARHGVVVEGRDTGSVVFPRAQHKFFLDADAAVRARRRQRELEQRYGDGVSLAEVRDQLEFRDGLDRTRKVGPLIKPSGAVAIDTSHLTAPQVVHRMLRYVHPARRAVRRRPS